MTEYTPTTDDVQVCYLYSQENPDGTFIKSQREHDAEFNRWLDEVRAEAIREACEAKYHCGGWGHLEDSPMPCPDCDEICEACGQSCPCQTLAREPKEEV